MKIIHFVSYFQELLSYEENISAAYHSERFSTVVITSDRYFPFPHYSTSMQPRLGSRIRDVGFYCYEGTNIIRLPTLIEFDKDLIPLGLIKMISKISPDVIYCHNIFGYGPALLSIIKYFFRKKYRLVFDFHMLPTPKTYISKLFYKISELLFLPFLRKAGDVFIGTTPHSARYLKEYYGFTPKKVLFLPLPVDRTFFEYSTLTSNSETFTILFSGKIYEEKGLETVIEVFNQLSLKYDHLELVLVGDGPEKYLGELESLLGDHCKLSFKLYPFTDKRQLAQYFSRADIGLWIGEVPSISTNEALAVGLPIAVRLGNQGSYEAKASGGFVYRDNRNKELMEFIDKMIQSTDHLNSLKERAKQFATDHLSIESHTDKIVDTLSVKS